MKSRWKRSAVVYTGNALMKQPAYKVNALEPDVVSRQEELLLDGYHPTIVVKKLHSEFGVQTDFTTHRSKLNKLRGAGATVTPRY